MSASALSPRVGSPRPPSEVVELANRSCEKPRSSSAIRSTAGSYRFM